MACVRGPAQDDAGAHLQARERDPAAAPLVEAVIISDANSRFIEWILAAKGHAGGVALPGSCQECVSGRAWLAADSAATRPAEPPRAPSMFSGAAAGVFSAVYTNPATETEGGCLHVAPHHAHACSSCPVNMCKQAVLRQHLSARAAEGVAFDEAGACCLCHARSKRERAVRAGGGGGGGRRQPQQWRLQQ